MPYIWKELGTQCRNLKQVHTIVRMMRMIGEIVCPSVLLLGEVVMEPEKVVPYFGTLEKPECHMLYNVTTMATTWHTVATRDTTLLRQQLDKAFALPKEYVFLNYLRCHGDIGWGLDYDALSRFGITERSHKAYLNNFFRGYEGVSISLGELYNEDPVTGDARLCGTTASLCGLQTALMAGDPEAIDLSVRAVVMLHGYMFMQSGIPVLYSGDEIGSSTMRATMPTPTRRWIPDTSTGAGWTGMPPRRRRFPERPSIGSLPPWRSWSGSGLPSLLSAVMRMPPPSTPATGRFLASFEA